MHANVQVEQQKYEGRILALQRAKQEAVSRVDQERSRAQDLQLQVEHLAADKSKWVVFLLDLIVLDAESSLCPE